MSTKAKVDHREPRRYGAGQSQRDLAFIGAGPRLSLDQKITFINENNCLAKRITQIGNRREFLSGIFGDNQSRASSRAGSRQGT